MSEVAWQMKGQYIKNCNCIAACPCDTTGFPYPEKGCEGMCGMYITQGNFGKVKLDGLSWVAVYMWPGALHEGNGTIQPFVDKKASQEQRNAILTILSGQAGNVWFEVLASVVKTIHEPQFLPIKWKFDKKGRTARVSIPGFLETESAPLTIPATDDKQLVIVRMPTGMEYREYYVAEAAVLTGTAPIKFDYTGRHSSIAEVNHTHKGLQA